MLSFLAGIIIGGVAVWVHKSIAIAKLNTLKMLAESDLAQAKQALLATYSKRQSK